MATLLDTARGIGNPPYQMADSRPILIPRVVLTRGTLLVTVLYMDLIAVLPDSPRASVVVSAFLDDRWIVWARLMTPGFEVAELRIAPSPPPLRTSDGTEARVQPDRETLRFGYSTLRLDDVPEGGLPFGRLRDIHLRTLQSWAREHVEAWGDWLEEQGHVEGLDVLRRLMGENPTAMEQEPPEQRLARLAAEYIELVEQGELHPNKVLAERWGRTAGWVATEIHRARRQYGLMTKRNKDRGQADRSSSLTKKGKAALEAARKRLEENGDA